MTNINELRHWAAEAAIQAVSGATTSATDAQERLKRTISRLTPALRLLSAQEHAAAIKSFVNPARIDIEVTVVTRCGDVISTAESEVS